MLCLERLLPGEIQALLQPARCPQHRSVEQRPGGACCVPIASVRHGLQLLNFNHLKPRVANQLEQLVQREVQHRVLVPLQRAAVQPQPAWSQGVSDRTHGIFNVIHRIDEEARHHHIKLRHACPRLRLRLRLREER